MSARFTQTKTPSQAHSVPWFWPFAAAIEMEQEGLKLFQNNLKFVTEAEKITDPPPPQ